MRWFGHVRRMDDGRIPKNILYGELAAGKRNTGRPLLRFKDVCKRDMKNLDINTDSWEVLASDRLGWRGTLRTQLQAGEEKMMEAAAEKRALRKSAATNRSIPSHTDTLSATYTCDACGRDCHSRISLFSHRR